MSCNTYDSPASASLRGTIVGYVVPYSELGVVVQDRSGVRVSLDDTSISALSDSTGRWELKDVPIGTYNIGFSKAGYSTNKVIGYGFAANGTAFIASTPLPAEPKLAAALEAINIDSADLPPSVVLKGESSETIKDNNRLVMFFFSLDESVANQPGKYVYNNSTLVPVGSNRFLQKFSTNLFIENGFKHGDRIYVCAYTASRRYYSYVDVKTGKYVYSGLSANHSGVTSFQLP